VVRHDGGRAVLVNAQKTVRMPRRPHGVNGDLQAAVRAFFRPTGMDRPLAISRCVWDSVVRAPMAAQVTRSAMYCGTIGSRNSVARRQAHAGVCWSNSRRAIFQNPFSMILRTVEMRVRLIQPLPADVVRGFSK